MDLKLDANEGEAPSPELLTLLAGQGPDLMRRYPDASAVQALLAERIGVPAENVIVTAGGDDALDRICRAVLCPGRELLTTDPSFEMLPRYARLAGAAVTEIDWPGGAYPTDEMIARLRPETAVVAVVSPNNPSGAVAGAEDLRRLSAAAPDAVLLADLAYTEFADVDLTPVALSLPNTVVVRTLSKAWGCAGLRVGYAIGPAELIGWMRASGGPYAVARPSIALALARLEQGEEVMHRFVRQVREDRTAISEALRKLGQKVGNSQGNFVYAEVRDSLWLRDALAGLGIGIRAFPGHPRLGNAVRITCPGDAAQCARLVSAIEAALGPECLLVHRADRGAEGLPSAFRVAEDLPGEDSLSAEALRGVMEARGVWRGWLAGDTPAALASARAAGLVPFGIAGRAPAEELTAAGAARIITSLRELEGLLP